MASVIFSDPQIERGRERKKRGRKGEKRKKKGEKREKKKERNICQVPYCGILPSVYGIHGKPLYGSHWYTVYYGKKKKERKEYRILQTWEYTYTYFFRPAAGLPLLPAAAATAVL